MDEIKLGGEEGCAPAGRRGDAATAGAVTYLRPATMRQQQAKTDRPATHAPTFCATQQMFRPSPNKNYAKIVGRIN